MSFTTKAAVILLALTATGQAQARPPLREVPQVVDGFYAIGLADEVRKNCPSISPRMVRAYMFLRSLESFARDAGYSDAEIDALSDDKAAKDRLKARIRSDLAARGASPDKPEGYCAVGREEIARDSAAGRLLRTR